MSLGPCPTAWSLTRVARLRRLFFLSVAFGFRGFPNFLNVGKIAQAARRKFGRNQVVFGNKERREAALRVEDAFNPPFPCGVKFNSLDARKNIDRDRLLSEADKVAPIGKV